MSEDHDLSNWRMRTISSGNVNHVATSPGCPNSPHAMRDCMCRTFSQRRRADAYIREQSNKDND